MDRTEIVERIVRALEKEFGEQWNVAVNSLRLGDYMDIRVFMSLEPHGPEMPPIERRYRDKCHRVGLEEDWIYSTVELDGATWTVMGWRETPSDWPIVLKTALGRFDTGQSYTYLKVEQLRKLAWEGYLELGEREDVH